MPNDKPLLVAAASRAVTWRTLTAQYSQRERALMRSLPERERWFIHAAKHLFGGELR